MNKFRVFCFFSVVTILAATFSLATRMASLSDKQESPDIRPPDRVLSPISIGVLPLANKTGDPKLKWLSVGIQDAMSLDLRYLSGFMATPLPDIAGQSKQSLRNLSQLSRADAIGLAQSLLLSHIVVGRYERAGNETGLFMQMEAIYADTGKKVWEHRIRAEHPTDLLAQEPDMVISLAGVLNVPLKSDEVRRVRSVKTVSQDAFRLNAKGLAFQLMAVSEKTMSHEERALAFFRQAAEADPGYAEAWNNLGWNLAEADHALAVSAFAKAVHVKPDLVDANIGLGYCLLEMGGINEAMSYLERAVDLNPSLDRHYRHIGNTRGTEYAREAKTLNHLADSYRVREDYARAETFYKQALALNMKSYGPEHLQVAVTLNNLALVYHSCEDYARAEPLYQRALAIKESVCGSDHASVAVTLNHLAGLYDSLGSHALAKPLYQRVLAINETLYGPDHPDIAMDLNNLALVCHSLGDYAQAKPLYTRALAIEEKFYGADHVFVAMTLKSLGELCHSLGDYGQAKSFYTRALAIHEASHGPAHPEIALDVTDLADVYDVLGDVVQAESFYKRAMILSEMSGSPGLQWRARDGLSRFFAGQEHFNTAIFFGKQAVNILQCPDTDIPKTKPDLQRAFLPDKREVCHHLANLLTSQARRSEARQVLALVEKGDALEKAGARPCEKVVLNAVEQDWAKGFGEISAQLAVMGKEMGHLGQKSELGLTMAEKARQEQELGRVREKLDQYLTDIMK